MSPLRFIVAFAFSCGLLYAYINKQNNLTKLRLEIPNLWAKLRYLEQENTSLIFLVEKLESPEHLMQIASLPEYQYLHYPEEDHVLVLANESS